MAQVITRIYAGADKAASAVKEVKALGYGDSEVFVTNPSAGAAKADVAASLAQAGLGKAEADGVADEVLKGRSVVIVHAAFGGGAKATAALDKFAPIAAPATTISAPAVKAKTTFSGPKAQIDWNDATPLSTWMNWPTLLNSPTPLSDYFKFSVLSDWTFTKVELSDDPAPLSKKFGWELLKDDPTPLSKKMNWAVLRD